MKEKPYLVIGSSQKGLKVAEEIKNQLSEVAEITVWPKLFLPNENYLSTLLTTNLKFDFAVLVFTADDDLKTKGKKVKAARDNVIFELGLAFGRLGTKRSFAVVKRSVNIPSDLHGLKLLRFPSSRPSTLPLSLKPACTELKTIIEEQYKEPQLGLLPSTALAIGYFKNFLEKVCDEISRKKTIKVNGKIWKNTDDFLITVIIPETLAYADPKNIEKNLLKNNLVGLPIKTKSRPYPLYVKADTSVGKRLELYDIPTTLAGCLEAIDKVIPNNFLGAAELEDFLQVRELRNFKKTLEDYLKKKKYSHLKDHIIVKYIKHAW